MNGRCMPLSGWHEEYGNSESAGIISELFESSKLWKYLQFMECDESGTIDLIQRTTLSRCQADVSRVLAPSIGAISSFVESGLFYGSSGLCVGNTINANGDGQGLTSIYLISMLPHIVYAFFPRGNAPWPTKSTSSIVSIQWLWRIGFVTIDSRSVVRVTNVSELMSMGNLMSLISGAAWLIPAGPSFCVCNSGIARNISDFCEKNHIKIGPIVGTPSIAIGEERR